MSISDIREELQARLAAFLWNQWAQMGALASASRHDQWAADPEALLLLSFEVGRQEPRLFEEVLDWLLTNERLISVQRLRNLAQDDDDRALIEAVLGWVGQKRRRPRLGAKPTASELDKAPQPFFRNPRLPITEPDPAFLAQGFLKEVSEPSRKSQGPDLRLPINFAFRMRLLLGISARAEAVRVLLTIQAPWADVQTLAKSTAFSKRNVQEALASLRAAGVLDSWAVGNEQRFQSERSRWAHFLDVEKLPLHYDWPQLFNAYRLVLRWLADPANENLSDYMLSSEARTLAERVIPDLRFAGIPIDSYLPADDASYLDYFAKRLRELGPI